MLHENTEVMRLLLNFLDFQGCWKGWSFHSWHSMHERWLGEKKDVKIE